MKNSGIGKIRSMIGQKKALVKPPPNEDDSQQDFNSTITIDNKKHNLKKPSGVTKYGFFSPEKLEESEGGRISSSIQKTDVDKPNQLKRPLTTKVIRKGKVEFYITIPAEYLYLPEGYAKCFSRLFAVLTIQVHRVESLLVGLQ